MPTNNQPFDRVLDSLLMQAEQEAIQRTRNPTLRRDDPYLLGLRQAQYESIIDGYRNRDDLTRDEKRGLTYVRTQLRRINARLHPNLLSRIRYLRPVNWVFNWIRGRAALIEGYNNQLQDQDRRTIQEQNVQRLSEEMKKAGFKVIPEAALKRAIAQDRPYFNIPYAASDDAKTDYVLHFKKLPGTDAYYLDNFDAATKPTPQEVLRGNPIVRQNFSLIDDYSLSAHEAASVIRQIPVARNIDGQDRWLITDPLGERRWVEFDLQAALNKLPIKELRDPARMQALVTALHAGSSREVTFRKNNQTHELRVQVDSWAEGLLFKDKNGNLVDVDRIFQSNANVQKVLSMAQDEAVVRDLHPRRS
ncbi:MAG TPA: hypothetical protein VKU83_11130 [Puia sp.]|nr:hypothetical protein [Puia sp.]